MSKGWGSIANGTGGAPGRKGGWGGVANASVAPPDHSSGGGGGLFGWIGSKLSIAGHDLAAFPGQTWDMADTEAHLLAQTIRHPWVSGPNDPNYVDNTAAGKHANELVHGIVQGTVQSVEHPLRDPFQTLLTVAPIGHGAFRGAEIARGVDIAAPRTLAMGDAEIPLPPASGNAMIRAGQRLYGSTLQHALDTNPDGRLAGHAANRIGGSIAETSRYQARMRTVPAQLLARAGRELRGSVGKHVPGLGDATAAQAALRLTSENSMPAEAAAFHRAQAEAGVQPDANLKLAGLYDRIHQSGMLRQDEHGNVGVNAEKFPKLAAADAALARAQADAERIVHEHGLMSDEGQRARLDAPGQIRRAAVEQTLAPADPLASPDVALEKRLTELDARYNSMVDKLAEAEGKPGDFKRVTEYQNAVNKKLARRGMAYDPVSVQLRDYAESKLLKLLHDRPDLPQVQKFKAEMDEAAAIRRELAARHDPFGVEIHQPHTVEPTAPARPGRGYVPYKITEAKAPRSDIARQVGPVVPKTRSPIGAHEFTGEALRRGEVPDATTALVARHLQRLYRFVNTDMFRRAVLKTGSKVKRSSREILVRDPDAPAASHFSLEIERDLGRKHVTLDELAQLEGHRQALSEQMAHIVKGGFNADAALQKDRLAPAMAEARKYGIGAEAPKGFLWVDRNVFGDLGNAFAFSRGRVGKLGDAINSAVTTATVYLKPGHFPQRFLTNATTALLQGALNPGDLGASVRVWRQLSHEDRIRALGAAGQGGYESMPHDSEGLIGEAASRGAMWWAKHVDAPFRFASIAYEARKAGYKGAPMFRRFLHVLEQPDRFPKDEVVRADAAAKEANRAAIAYDRMSDGERRTLGRVVWFYPWVRSATLYAGRALTNHPYQASIIAQLGVEGRKNQQAALGDLPSFEYGLTPLGGNQVSDLQRLFPFSTAADLLQLPSHPEAVVGNANPAVSGLLGLLTNLDGFGKQQHGSRLNTAFDNVLSSLPETQIVDAYLHRNQPQGARMFPKSGAWGGTREALLRALLGVEYPRTINPAAAHSAAARERSGR